MKPCQAPSAAVPKCNVFGSTKCRSNQACSFTQTGEIANSKLPLSKDMTGVFNIYQSHESK